MHVGVNARPFSVSEPRGSVQAAIQLVEALEARPEVTVTLFGHPDSRQNCGLGRLDSTLFAVNSQAFGLAWEQVVLPRLADRRNVDVLFSPNGNTPVVPADVPLVHHLQDISVYQGYGPRSFQALQRVRVPRMLRNADAITAISEFTKSEAVQELDVEPEDVTVIHNGIDEIYFDESAGAPLELPPEYVLYVGGVDVRKNVERLVESFERFKTRYDTGHEFVMIGPRPKYIHRNFSLDVDNATIRVLGFVEKQQLKTAYENADAFVFPSLHEGFGLPPVEALACGTPVVASNRASLPEVLDGGAHLVDPTDVDAIADGLHRVLTDEQYRERILRDGRRRIRRFTWDRAADELLDVFRSVVDDRPRNATLQEHSP